MKNLFRLSLFILVSSTLLYGQVDVNDLNKKISRIDYFGDLPTGWKYKDDGIISSLASNYEPGGGSSAMYQYEIHDPNGIKYDVNISPKLKDVKSTPELRSADITSLTGLVNKGGNNLFQRDITSGEVGKQILFAHRFFENTGIKVEVSTSIENYSSSVEDNLEFLAEHIDAKLQQLIQAENVQNSMKELMAPLIAGLLALAGLGGIGASMGAFSGISDVPVKEPRKDTPAKKQPKENSGMHSNEIDSIKDLAEKCYSQGAEVVNASDGYLRNLQTKLSNVDKEIAQIENEINQASNKNIYITMDPQYQQFSESSNKAYFQYRDNWEEMDSNYSSFWHSGYKGENAEEDYSYLDEPTAVLDGMENVTNYKESQINELETELSKTDNPDVVSEIKSEIKIHKDRILEIGDLILKFKSDLNKLRESHSLYKTLAKQLDAVVAKHKRAEQTVAQIKSDKDYDGLLAKQKDISKQIDTFSKTQKQSDVGWLKDVKKDYDNRLTKLNNFIKTNQPTSKNYESNLTDLIIDLQKAQKRICQAVDYESVQVDEKKKEAEYIPPYDTYEDDIQDLTFGRENLHKFEKDLRSYESAYKNGDPGYNRDIINNMKKDISYWKNRVKEVENTIRGSKGKVPKDNYTDNGLSPYGGVGQEAANDMKKFKDFQTYQDGLSRKVENFLKDHPEYGRLRDNLYDENGYVNKELAQRMMQHNQKHMSDPRNLEDLNSDAYSMALFAHNTSKELFTGLKSDGSTSYLGAGFKTLVNIASGGSTEMMFETANAAYQMGGSIASGKSGWHAFSGSVTNLLFDEMTSNLMQKPTLLVGDAIKNTFPKTTSKIFDFLQKDVKDALGGTKIKPGKVSTEAMAAKNAMKKALQSGDKDEILSLYKNHGMENLAELEANGHISVGEAKKLNDLLTNEVNDSINKGTITSIDDFQRSNDVKIKEVLVGDSGSSAKGKGPRSVYTDADRTTLVVFEDESLKKYAHKNNMSVDEAYENLSQDYAKYHEDHVGSQLKTKGLTTKDVDFGTYDRIMKGHSGGPADTYPTGFTSARQSISGTTTVYKTDDLGNVKMTYKTSGDALVDQNVLMKTDYGTKGVVDDPLKISNKELKPIFEQQKMAMNKYTDPKSIAKGLNRANYCTTRCGQSIPDPKLMNVATEIAKNPQKMNEILQSNGYSINSFVDQSKNMMKNFFPNLDS